MEISEDSCAPLFVLQGIRILPCHLASFEEPPDGHQDGLSHLPQLGVETNVSNVQNPYDIPLYSLFNRDPYNGKLLLGGSSQDL